MIFSYKDEEHTVSERQTTREKRSRRGIIAAGAALGLAALLALGWGEGEQPIPEEAKFAQAQAEYDTAFEGAAPIDKFRMQYINNVVIVVDSSEPGSGIVGSFEPGTSGDRMTFNNSCLADTPYRADSVASLDPENPSKLTLQSAQANVTPLRFSGLQESTVLTPLDQQTINVLDAYGCETGITDLEPSVAYPGVNLGLPVTNE